MKILPIIAGLALVLAVSACAAGTSESHQAVQNGVLNELLLGFWHGLIAPFTLIGEIIDKVAPGALPWRVRFYEARDTDVIYDVGFFIGLFGGPSVIWTGSTRRRVAR
jgi:hypothetical protein